MIVRVQLFAAARRAAGDSVVRVELGAEPTIGVLRRALARQFPALESLEPYLHFAIDQQFAGDEQTVGDQMEIACFPPVSGG